MTTLRHHRPLIISLLIVCSCAVATALAAQTVAVSEITLGQQAIPTRLMGYGIVVGLPGTGDRSASRGSQETVQSIANILRRFGVQVPAEYLRTQNAAAVLVTAEVSPFLRPGGRFDVQVSSIGDARSLRGGTLWMTPMVAEVDGPPIATAQGALLLPVDGSERRSGWGATARGVPETGARLTDGGVIEVDMPRVTQAANPVRLALREPNQVTAQRIAVAINGEMGKPIATVEDPGSIALSLSGNDIEKATTMARIASIKVVPARVNRVVIEARTGSVAVGGDISLTAGIVSAEGIVLRIGAPSADTAIVAGQVDLPAGSTVRQLVAALHAVKAPATQVASVFEALRRAGVLDAEVIVR